MNKRIQNAINNNCLHILSIIFPDGRSREMNGDISKYVYSEFARFGNMDYINTHNTLVRLINEDGIAIFKEDKLAIKDKLAYNYFLIKKNDTEKIRHCLAEVILMFHSGLSARFNKTCTKIYEIIGRCTSLTKAVEFYALIEDFVYENILPVILYRVGERYNLNLMGVLRLPRSDINEILVNIGESVCGGSSPVTAKYINNLIGDLKQLEKSDTRDEFISYLENADVQASLKQNKTEIPKEFMDFLAKTDNSEFNRLKLLKDLGNTDVIKNNANAEQIQKVIEFYDHVDKNTFTGNKIGMTNEDIKVFSLIKSLEIMRLAVSNKEVCCNDQNGNKYIVNIYNPDVHRVKVNDTEIKTDYKIN